MSARALYDHPDHKPISGIPKKLVAVMDLAAQRKLSWTLAGRSVASYLRQRWGTYRVIDGLFEPMHALISATVDHGSPCYRIACLAWLYALLPDVVAGVPQDRLVEFNEGVYRELYLDSGTADPELRPGMSFGELVYSNMLGLVAEAS